MPRDGSLTRLRWLALRVRWGAEGDVADELAELGLERYLPVETTRRHGRRGPRTVQAPLFPGYLFPRADVTAPTWRRTWSAIAGIDGVVGLLCMGHAVVAIPDDEIALVRTMEGERAAVRPEQAAKLDRGAWVRLTEGPFASWDGHVVHTGMGWWHQRDAFGSLVSSARVPIAIVTISLFGRRSRVEIRQSALERIDN